jgi:hypothetical protein
MSLPSHIALTVNGAAQPFAGEYGHVLESVGQTVTHIDAINSERARKLNIRTAAGLIALTGCEENGSPSLPDAAVVGYIREAFDANVPVVFPQGFPDAMGDTVLAPEEWQTLGGIALPEDMRGDPIHAQVEVIVTELADYADARRPQ